MNRMTAPDDGRDDGDNVQSRRVVIKVGATAFGMSALGVGALSAAAQGDSATPTNPALDATPSSCVLTPELTQGPYYLADDLIRADITEGRPGVPLTIADRRVRHQSVRSTGERGGPCLALRCTRLLLGCQRQQPRKRRDPAADR